MQAHADDSAHLLHTLFVDVASVAATLGQQRCLDDRPASHGHGGTAFEDIMAAVNAGSSPDHQMMECLIIAAAGSQTVLRKCRSSGALSTQGKFSRQMERQLCLQIVMTAAHPPCRPGHSPGQCSYRFAPYTATAYFAKATACCRVSLSTCWCSPAAQPAWWKQKRHKAGCIQRRMQVLRINMGLPIHDKPRSVPIAHEEGAIPASRNFRYTS